MPRRRPPLALVLAVALLLGPAAAQAHPPVQPPAAQDTPFPPDAVRPSTAAPPSDPLAGYRADRDYDYTEQAQGVSWLERLWSRFMEMVGQWLRAATWDERFWRITVGLVLLILAFGLARLFARYGAGTLYRRTGRADDADALPERLDALDLDAWLREALAGGDARRAVRAVYLRTLRTLEQAGHLRYRPMATNADYLRTLAPPLREALAPLARRFEELWYGDYPARPDDAAAAQRHEAAVAAALPHTPRQAPAPAPETAPAEVDDAA